MPSAMRARVEAKIDEIGLKLGSYSHHRLKDRIAFALGFLLPVVAAALTIQMGVAIARAHWGKGFWNTKGGIEFPFTLGAIAAINGVADPGAYSLDRALGLPTMGVGVYAGVLVLGVLAYLVGSRTMGAQGAVKRAA